MKTSRLIARQASYVLAVLAGLAVVACDPDVDFSAEDQLDKEAIAAESDENFFYEDVDDMTAVALEEDLAGGKAQGDDRLNGATVTREGDVEEGTLRINFGANDVADAKGRNRRGAIVITYSGRQDRSNSTRTITFENFFVDGVKIEGTRTVTVVSFTADLIVEDIDVEDGVITFPNGDIARRELHRRRECHRTNNILDRLIIYGTESGNHRNGRGFQIEILEALVFDRECMEQNDVLIAVDGKKKISHGNREITVEYGDGTCDNLVTITNKNGRTWEYEVGG
jgi:hypothetical protein